jgi:alpha-galactosidase
MNARLRKSCLFTLLLFLVFLACVPPARALENGLALTPPMGWNSWNRFACNVTEDLVKSAADALVSSGMKDAGYEYVVIDDCWQVSRDAAGNIVADAKTFPSGIKALADYVHSKGLKFGIYSDAARKPALADPAAVDMNTRTPCNTPPGASTT